MTTTPVPEPLSADSVGLAFQVLFDAGVVLEPPLTRAVMTEALHAALRANGPDVTRGEMFSWISDYLGCAMQAVMSDDDVNGYVAHFIAKFAGRRISHE